MKKLIINLLKPTVLIIFIGGNLSALAQNNQPVIDPNDKPAVFLQEGIKVPNKEAVTAFMPDGNTVYLADSNTICVSKRLDGRWSKPVAAKFSGHWQDWDPAISPDGKRIIFVSTRPAPDSAQDKPQKRGHLWYADNISGDTWTIPKHFDGPVNINGASDFGPSVSAKGSICFCSKRNGTKGMRGYYTKWLGDHYAEPEMLLLNGDKDIYDPFIAPDESYIIFSSDKKLYISYNTKNGWSEGQLLGTQFNDGNWYGDPVVSPDGKMLYFSSSVTDGILMIPIHIPKT